jgi:hypothetical protein
MADDSGNAPLGDNVIYSVKIYKAFGGRGPVSAQHSNTYHIRSDAALGSPELDALAMKLVAFEKRFHLDITHFMRVVIATYTKEGRNNTDNMRAIELTGTGTRPTDASAPEPTELTFRAKMAVATGRSGSAFYRGVLVESGVQAGAGGGATFTGLPAEWDTARSDLMLAGTPIDLVIPSRGAADGMPGRDITSLEAASVTVMKRNRKRKKTEAKSTAGVLDNIAAALPLIASVAAFVLTKGKALPAIEKLGIATAAGQLGDTVSAILTAIADPVENGG